MRCAQWVLGGVSPSVRQSSWMVWSKVPGRDRSVEPLHGGDHLLDRQPELLGHLGDRASLGRREDRRHEAIERLGVDEDVGDLIGLLRHHAAPDGVAHAPEVLAFVVISLPVFVHDDAEGDAVEAGHDAAVELGRTRVDRHHVGLGGVADRFGAVLEQEFEQGARIEGGAADEEVVRGRAPGLFQPGQVRLEAARRDHHRLGGDGHRAIAHAHRSAPEPPVHDVQPDDLGLVADVHPQALGAPEERVHHGLRRRPVGVPRAPGAAFR